LRDAKAIFRLIVPFDVRIFSGSPISLGYCLAKVFFSVGNDSKVSSQTFSALIGPSKITICFSTSKKTKNGKRKPKFLTRSLEIEKFLQLFRFLVLRFWHCSNVSSAWLEKWTQNTSCFLPRRQNVMGKEFMEILLKTNKSFMCTA
jgi:hypothetical protein